jgi:hypothetical protein
LAETKDFDEALRMLLSMGNGTTARILAWAILEGHDVTALVGLSPAVTIVADRARQDAGRAASEEDARFLAAMAMVLAVAWRLFGPAALAAAGLDSSQLEPYGERITQFAPLLGGTAVPPEAGHGH